MSGLLERIVRRRRFPASARPGATPTDGAASAGPHSANGHQPVVPRASPVATVPGAVAAEASESRSLLERGRMRRRARYLRRLREVQLRDIGGFVLELYRFGRERQDLVQAKVAAAAQTARELRALEHALGEHLPLHELRQAGIAGGCPRCGAVYGTTDRYCSSCGTRLGRHTGSADETR